MFWLVKAAADAGKVLRSGTGQVPATDSETAPSSPVTGPEADASAAPQWTLQISKPSCGSEA